MLKLLDAGAPPDLGKNGEITKHSPTFDRITGDTADLRVYRSSDGAKDYVRIWEGATEGGAARWYEIVKPTADATAKK